MAFNPQEQEIIKYGVSNGKSRQEVEKAIFNYRNGIIKQPEQPQPTTFSDGLSRVASTYGKNLKEQAVGGVETAQKSFGMGVDTMQQAQQMPMGTRQEKERASGLASAGAAQIGVGAMSGTIQTVFSPLTAALLTGIQGYKELDQATGGKIQNQLTTLAQAHPELIKGYSDMVTQNPKTAQFVMDSINVLTAGLGGKPALEATKDLTRGLVTGAKESVGKLPPIPPSGGNMADDVLQSGKNLRDSIQLSIAKKNVNPQLESSAERLMKETTQNVEDPIVAYENYLSQSKESMGDIKVDAPISTVGGKIGDAFMNVVKQRQSVGATLGEELKSVGKLRVSVAEPKSKLLAELSDSGLSYNPKTKQLTSFQGSKFAPEEVSMLNQFVKDVEALGETPTVSQIDNFIAKTRSDLSFAKGKSGVVGTTNAERIIKGNLAGLRESLNPANNGISRLSPYWKANQTYSELSDFLEEGSTFLGKKTQSGDFAKDASVAKSSVQSILNGGKKDWLIKLEGLTGYPALDDSVLALQAMKDAGDFKGLSLLQAMQETGGLPTSKAGFIQKVLDMAVERGEKLIVGTPEEQTRALLQSLKKPQTAKNIAKKLTPSEATRTKKYINKEKSFNSGTVPKTVEELVANATKYNPQFVKDVGSVSKSLGFDVAHGPVKKAVRIQDKINAGEITLETARDANRSTILAKSSSDLTNIESKIKEQFGNVSRVKNKFGDEYDYKSAIINVRTPLGHEAEVAVTTPNMWKAKMKLGGQDLYDITRDTTGKYTPEEVLEADRKMKKLYRDAAIADGLIQ